MRLVTNSSSNGFLIGTNFTGDLADLLAAIASDRDSPEQVAAGKPAVEPLSAPLASLPLKGRLKEWWLAEQDSPKAILDPERILTGVIRTWDGKTSRIAAVDPSSQRVQTFSGNVYELGVPETSFAAHGRHVLRRMGF